MLSYFFFKFKRAILMIYVEKWHRRDLLVKILLFCDISMPNCSALAIRNENRFVHVKLNIGLLLNRRRLCMLLMVLCTRTYHTDYAKAINFATETH